MGGSLSTPRRKVLQPRSCLSNNEWLNAPASDSKRCRKAMGSPDHTTCKTVLRHDIWTPSYIDSPRKVGKVGPSPGGADTLVLA